MMSLTLTLSGCCFFEKNSQKSKIQDISNNRVIEKLLAKISKSLNIQEYTKVAVHYKVQKQVVRVQRR